MTFPQRFTGKTVLVTGAGTGFGAAVAVRAAQEGADVAVHYRGSEAGARQTAARVEAQGRKAFLVQADITEWSQIKAMADAVFGHFGQLDVLVNNAGRGISRMVSELTDADVDDMVTINIKSVIYGIQAVLPHMQQRGHGQIMTVSSGLSRFPFAAQRSAYSAAKAAVNLLMGSLRMELRATFPNIHCTTVMPGVVATEFGSNALHGGLDSRKIPNAQPVEEVAVVMADAIEKPVAEVYTRSQMRELAAKYFAAEDVAVLEGAPPFFASPQTRTIAD